MFSIIFCLILNGSITFISSLLSIFDYISLKKEDHHEQTFSALQNSR